MIERTVKRGNALAVDVEVGMPLTGTANLAESPLLMLIGDIRWRQIQEICGTASRDLVDDAGQRVYATFYYIAVHFPRGTPMAAFGENDRFTIVNTLHLHEEGAVDGFHLLYPADWPDNQKVALASEAEIRHLGIPYVRSCNTFVRMVQGASWLKKATPAALRRNRTPVRPGPPDTYGLLLKVSQESGFAGPPHTYSALGAEPVRWTYRPQPDRDLNGVGLLYFANYPRILDVVEREILSANTALLPLASEILDRRTIEHREIAYLCNIVPSDSIDVVLDAWIENPFLRGEADPADEIRLFVNYEMYRRSDGRKMLVSTAEKVIWDTTLGAAGLLEPLRELANRPPRRASQIRTA
jgi:probable biosynthetic protein (TIGR04098 family)